jgi:isocitrate lyase
VLSLTDMSDEQILELAIEHLQFKFITLSMMQGASPAFQELANSFTNTMPAQVEVLQHGVDLLGVGVACPTAIMNFARAVVGDDVD